jgi:hypothetical protein
VADVTLTHSDHWRRAARRQFEHHLHRIQPGAVPIGGDGGDDEAEAGVKILCVLTGAERHALGAECSCVGQACMRKLRTQALVMPGAVDHAPAEGRAVVVVEGEAAAGDEVAVVFDDQIVVGAVWVK